MNENTVSLVKGSFAKVEPIADQAAELFYAKLFAMAPEVQHLFKGDMKVQGQKLMQMIKTAVNNLDKLNEIVPAVEGLGKRHVDYGVKPEHYDLVGAALLDTLKDGLGEEFTDEVKEAWIEVYTVLATTMKKAAYSMDD